MIIDTEICVYNKELNLKVNEQNEIIQYALIGGVGAGGIFVSYESVPADFIENFDSKYYLYIGGNIKINPDYVAPEIHL
ncbi:hypothetical protein CD144_01990 [Staphylococcus equorum subsp. linens]|uniref:DUF2977 domain-containing protein n=1 Tax=Staphylococcus equorum TaxID=246432 RepID=UPI000CD2AC22|nr:DUF2977 domain-containing protein [Staphylococcus equorum]PNZ09023.1 hypothetical protein CD144_01990 [Staphylococcus equorum subsp. linens]QQT16824.1 DUF2977 domain-containing protein [Staphylococcus equorum]